MAKHKLRPRFARGRKIAFPVSCVVWMDLLGYGSQILDANLDPSFPTARQAVDRLKRFHSTVASHSDPFLPALLLNDGAAMFRDLSYRSRSVTYDFLTRALAVHNAVDRSDREAGFPGCRTVVATGFRARSWSVRKSAPGHETSILARLDEGIITPKQAVREAMNARRVCGIVPELQANFAFSKAYLVDAAGTKQGFKGPACYIDLLLFTDPIPDWIAFRRRVPWSLNKVTATFGEFESIDTRAGGRVAQAGVRHAADISTDLAR
jgi:hypothetical protein